MRSLPLIIIFIFSLTACGKKGALIYPDMLVPVAPSATSASQIGGSVKLQFVLPDRDRAGRTLHDLAGVKISKRTSNTQETQDCSSCMSDYHLFRTLYLDTPTEGVLRFGNRILVLDGNVTAGKTYSYIVVPYTKEGFDGIASPQTSVTIVQPTTPPVLNAESFPTEIRVSFVSSPPVAGSFIGYNIYRTTQQNETTYMPLNREPFTGAAYIDSALERNTTYYYAARTVLKLESGSVVESLVSNSVEGMLKNDE
jgi:predicted small lipoprotein YifL